MQLGVCMALFDFDPEDRSAARFAARLPILSTNEQVWGYKLLFRSDVKNYFPSTDGETASRGVIDISSLIGLNTLCNGHPAFIVTTHDTLLGEYLGLLPPEKVVAEIPDSVATDAEVVEACRQLKAAGGRIALSNFRAGDPRRDPEIADFLTVDIKNSPLGEVFELAQRYRSRSPRLIAEKVETREDFQFCKNLGFTLFEGYFFRKPELMRARRAQSNRNVLLRLLAAVFRPNLDWKELEEIFKSDPMLYVRLLRYLNSAIFGLRSEIKTINQALTILGENEIRRWCRLSGMLELSKGKPSDLALSALVRARFAELIGARVEHGNSDLFQVGLLSLTDAILEISMRDVLEGLPVDDAVRTVLLENKGCLSPIYELILAVEAGVWPKVEALSFDLKIDPNFIAQSHWTAMEWAHSVVTVA